MVANPGNFARTERGNRRNNNNDFANFRNRNDRTEQTDNNNTDNELTRADLRGRGIDTSEFGNFFNGQTDLALNDPSVDSFFEYLDQQRINRSRMGLNAILEWLGLNNILSTSAFDTFSQDPRAAIQDAVDNDDTAATADDTTATDTTAEDATDATADDAAVDDANADPNAKPADPNKPAADPNKPADPNAPPAPPAVPPAAPAPNGGPGALNQEFFMNLRERCKKGELTPEQACAEAEKAAEQACYAGAGVAGLGDHDSNIKMCEKYVPGAGDGIDIGNSDTEEWTRNCATQVVATAKASARAQCNEVVTAEASATATAAAAAPSAAVQAVQAQGQTQAIAIKDQGHDDDPITLDLNGDGIKSSGRKTQFDVNADGTAETISDLSDGDGTLFVDLNGDGKLTDGTEMFGKDFGGKKYEDGHQALDQFIAKFDLNGDGKLSGIENLFAQAAGLRINKGSYTDGQTLTLNQADVASIGSSDASQKKFIRNFNGLGDNLVEMGGLFTRTDGSTGKYADIYFGQNA